MPGFVALLLYSLLGTVLASASDRNLHESSHHGNSFLISLPSDWEDLTPAYRKVLEGFGPEHVQGKRNLEVIFVAKPKQEHESSHSFSLMLVPAESSPEALSIQALEEAHMRYLLVSEGLGGTLTRDKTTLLGQPAHVVVADYNTGEIRDGGGNIVSEGERVIEVSIITLKPRDGRYYLLNHRVLGKVPRVADDIDALAGCVSLWE